LRPRRGCDQHATLERKLWKLLDMGKGIHLNGRLNSHRWGLPYVGSSAQTIAKLR
jgi:hypothetical protein